MCENFKLYATIRHIKSALGEPVVKDGGMMWNCQTDDGRKFTVSKCTDYYDDGCKYPNALFNVRGEDYEHTKEAYNLVRSDVAVEYVYARKTGFERCERLYEELKSEVCHEIINLIPENGDTLFVEDERALNEFCRFRAFECDKENNTMKDDWFKFCGIKNNKGRITLLGYPSINGTDDEHPFDPTDVHEISIDKIVSNHKVLDVMEMIMYYYRMDALVLNNESVWKERD